MAIDGINGNVENWRNKPVKEVVNNLDIVQDEDTECAQWAQAMSAVTNAPDNVTYDMAGGSVEQFTVELEQITKNGLPEEEQPEEIPPDVEGVGKPGEVPPEEEEPDVGDVDDTKDPEVPAAPEEETPPETVPDAGEEEEEGTDNPDDLANNDITTDDETIRKRRQKRGETPTEG